MLHVLLELHGVALAQLIQAGLQFLLLDVLVLLIFVLSWQILPRERAPKEIDNHVPNGLQVISPRLLLTQMGG